jgi:hypothetical protein
VINFLPGTCAALLPWMWSMLFHRELVVPYRSPRAARTEPPFPGTAEKY